MPSGILNLFKPVGASSFWIVRGVRRHTRVARVGHGGTLDPAAEGVLPILLGAATRLTEFVHDWPKTYRATLQLGATSDTCDREGRITPVSDPARISTEAVRAILPAFTGQILQVPPMHSAIKRGGEALYRKARRGEVVERAPRRVEVHHLALLEHDAGSGRVMLELTCGKGMYVRSLAHDLGARLGCGAYLAELLRTAFGPLRVDEAVRLPDLLAAGAGWERWLLPMDLPLRDWPALRLEDHRARAVQNGQSVLAPEAQTSGRHRLLDRQGRLLAWATVDAARRVQPHAVFSL